ncbi:MAG: PTS system mannose/fructose/sorbose family transporter subunit IID [Mycoplasmatales bacterium]
MNEIKVTKKVRYKVLYRWIFTSSISSNYEKMQALAYCYTMLPFLQVIHKNDEDALQIAVRNHLLFFNTNPWIAPYIIGVNIGIEEIEKNNSLEAISNIKTGLMGPLAGMGDSLFVVIPWTIFGAIAANMAINGSPFGIILWIIVSIILKALSFPLFEMGYTHGSSLVMKLENKMKQISASVSILGLMVVGALIPSVIKINVALQFTQDDFILEGQQILDDILPGMLPIILVTVVYFCLGKKIKPIYLIIAIMIIAIILGYFGILK